MTLDVSATAEMACRRKQIFGDSQRSAAKVLPIFRNVLTTICMETRSNNIVITDSSGLISLVASTDHNHKIALAAAPAHRDPDERLIILPTNVLGETVNVLGKRADHATALRAARELLDTESPFILIDTSTYVQAALTKFAASPEGVSFTDCIVMAVADHYATTEIFGFDKQFADAGYHRLEPSLDWQNIA